MRKQKKSFWALTFFLTLITTAFFLSGKGVGGELEPPDTLPTMPTLEDLYQLVKIQKGIADYEVWEDNIRFAILDNGTPEDPLDDVVLDRATNLIWARNANICGESNWEQAGWCLDGLVLCNLSGWRLPTIEEFVSLAEAFPSPRTPALPSGHPFVNVQFYYWQYYWSSTVDDDSPINVWAIYLSNSIFHDIFLTSRYCNPPYCGYTWPVREKP